ncbi:MAG: hypothetical protein ACXWJC_06375 [Croceibacterium sp.]
MWGDEEPSMREQLVKARAKIIAQLDEMRFRANVVNNIADREGGGPPDYRSVFGELQAQLREIDTLLGSNGEDTR